jgi:hypothetical protein
MNTKLTALALFLTTSMLVACTTSTYGTGLQAIPDIQNEYLLKVYIGGFSGGATADQTAEREIRQFLAENDFSSFEIIDRRHNLVPSYFEYHVRFHEVPIEAGRQ